MSRRREFRPTTLAVALAACFPIASIGNPLDPAVVVGGATFQTQGNTLTVTNAPGTVINWQSFSIGQDEVTRFIQQSAASQVLNRVIGGDPSQILGTLQSNGQVFLINPNGIVFGVGAQVDVAGLVVSSLGITNADFLSGRLSFASGATAGSIRNDGTLRAVDGGSIYLIAPSIENHGIVAAPDGSVVLAAGKTATLMDSNRPFVQVEITAGGEAINVGQLVASNVGIYAGAVRVSGTVEATHAVMDESGRIRFAATGDTTITADGVVKADGASGGEVRIESGGTTLVDGKITANGSSGTGGTIVLLGAQVGLREESFVDASGLRGGGSVFVGGGVRGMDPTLPKASRTYVAPGAIVRADAQERGDGGRIVVWGDQFAGVHGALSARGGAVGGNGGFIETSGGSLVVSSTPDVTAPAGVGGTWLIDPNNITIVAGTGFTGINNVNPFASTVDGAQLGVTLIRNALTGGANVTITTGAGGSQAGDIVWSTGAALDYNGSGTNSLTLSAHNSITLSSNISDSNATTTDRLNLTLTPNSDGVGGGGVTVMASTVLDLKGGLLQVNGGGGITFANGSTLSNATLQAGAVTLNSGSIYFNGIALATDLTVPSGTTLRVDSGDLTLSGANRTLTLAGDMYLYQQTGTQTLGGAGRIVFASSGATIYSPYGGSTQVIGSGITLTGTTNGQFQSWGNFRNEGIIRSEVAGTTITVTKQNTAGTRAVNVGLIEATAGSVTLGGGPWENEDGPTNGTIRANGGTLNLNGAFSTATLGNLQSPSGVMQIGSGGVLTNTGQTLALGSGLTTASLRLANGAITGGTITTANGATFTQLGSGTSYLNGVTLGTDFVVPSGAVLRVDSGDLNLSGTNRVLTLQGDIYLYQQTGTQTLGGTGRIVFANNGAQIYAPYGGSTQVIGPGITLTGTTNGQFQSWGNIRNEGTIRSEVAGTTITVTKQNTGGTKAVNVGTIEATAGVVTLAGGSWENEDGALNGTIRSAGGTMNLTGGFSTATLGNLQSPSGVMQIGTSGVLTNTGETLALGSGLTTASLRLAGGAINGGTITTANGATFTQLGSGTSYLNGVTLGTDFVVPSGAVLRVDSGDLNLSGTNRVLTLQGDIYLYQQTGTQTLGGTGRIVFANNGAQIYAPYGGSTQVIGPGITLTGTTNGQFQSWGNIRNEGTIRSEVAGTTITVTKQNTGGTKTVNVGLIEAVAGSVTLSGGPWENEDGALNGTIRAGAAGTVNLNGAFNTATLGNLQTTGAGVMQLTASGSIANTGQTLTLGGTGTSASLRIAGGAINGGTITTANGASLTQLASGYSYLNDVTLDTDFTVPAGGILRVDSGGLTLAGTNRTLTLVGDMYLYQQTGTQTLGGTGRIVFANAGAQIYSNYAGNTVVVGPNVTVSGTTNGGLQLYSNFRNEGTIRSEVAGTTITVTKQNTGGTKAVNVGLIEAVAGSVTLSGGPWENEDGALNGTIRANGGTLNLNGAFSTATLGNLQSPGGVLQISSSGSLDNTGQTLALGSGLTTASLRLAGGAINGGTVTAANGATFTQLASGYSYLNDVTLDTDFTVPAGGILRVDSGGLTLAGANRTLTLAGDMYLYQQTGTQTLGGTGRIVFANANAQIYSNYTNNTVVVGPNVTVSGTTNGSFQLYSSFRNEGTIRSEVAGTTITVTKQNTGGTKAVNVGLIEAVAGSVTLSGGPWENEDGALNGTIRAGAAGTVNLNGAFNTVTLGNLQATGAGVMQLSSGGSIANTGQTLTLGGAGTSASLRLAGGAITGGTVATVNGASLTLAAGTSRMNAVTLATDLTVPVGSVLQVDSGDVTLSGSNRVLTLQGDMYLYQQTGTQTLGGTGRIVFANAGAQIYANYTNNTVVVGPNVTVNATTNGAFSLYSNFRNEGAIRSDVAGTTITVNKYGTGTSENVGSIVADGSSAVVLNGTTATLDNTGGTIRASNGGRIDINTTIATSDLGTLDATGGTVRLMSSGVLDNTGDTFQPGVDMAGSLTVAGGTIRGGIVQDDPANPAALILVNGTSPRFDNVTVDYDLALAANQLLYVDNGNLTLANGRTLTIGSAAGAAYLYFTQNAAQELRTTAGGSAQVLFANASGTSYVYSNSSTLSHQLTIRPGITIGGTGDGLVYAPTLVNEGTIRAGATGQSINVQAYSFDNLSGGLVEAASGGSILFQNYATSASEFTNAGTIRAAPGGTVELDYGTFSGTFLSSLTSTGGTVAVGSVVDNTNQTLTLDPATIGNLNLFSGGTIRGGTVTSVGGATLTIPNAGSITLDGVTLDTDLVAAGNSTISVPGTLTIVGGHRLSLGSAGTSATLVFNGAAANSLLRGGTGTAEVAFASGTGSNLYHNSGTLDIGSGVLIHSTGGSGTINNNGRVFTNSGEIDADVSGQTINLVATGMTNSGLVGASNGGVLALSGTFNPASLGVFDANGGTVRIGSSAIFDLQGGVFAMTAATGGVELSAGTIRNGTLRDAGAAMTVGPSSGTLDGVTLDQNLTLASRNLNVPNGLAIQGGRTVNLEGGGVLTLTGTGVARAITRGGSGTAEIVLGNGAISANNTGTLTLGQGLLVRSGANGNGSIGSGNTTALINQGTIAVDQSGRSISLFANATGSIDNQGLIRVVQGASLSTTGHALVNNNTAVGGGLQIGGTITLGTGITLTNNGRFGPGNSPGLATISGNLVLGTNSVLDIEVEGLARGTQYDAIDVTGTATLGGAVNVIRFGAYTETAGDILRVVTAQALSGNFRSVTGTATWTVQTDVRNAFLQAISSDPILLWTLNGSGAWTTAANWNLNRVPTATDIVLIDQPGTINVALSSGALAARRLFAFDGVTINGATLTLAGSSFVGAGSSFALSSGGLGGAGDLTLTGASTWSGGVLSGGSALRLASGAVLTASGNSATTQLAGRTLEIQSGASATFNGEIESEPGTSVINNAGTLTLAGTRLSHIYNASGTITVNNTGTVNKTGAGVYDLGTDFNNDGTVNIQGGTLRLAGSGTSNGVVAIGGNVLELAGGTQTLTSASNLSGSGTLRTSGGSLVVNTTTPNFSFNGTVQTSSGSASFAPSMTLSQLTLSGGTTTFNAAVSTPRLTQSGGTLAGASTLTLSGPGSTWSGGTWSGGGRVVLNTGTDLVASGNSATTQLAGRTLEIQSGASATFNGEIESEPGTSVIANAGTLTLAGTRLSHIYNASGTITVNNTGTINKTGTGTYSLGANLNNDAVLNVLAGNLTNDGNGTSTGDLDIAASATYQHAGGTQTLTNASGVTGVGELLVSGGTLAVNTPTAGFAHTGVIRNTGGLASFAANLTPSHVALSGGTTTFNGSVITPLLSQSGGTLAGGSLVTLTGAGSTWTGGTWTSNGTVRLNPGASLTANGSSATTQLAGRTLEIQSGASATFNGEIESEPGTSVIANAGTLTLAGTRLSHIYNASGTITVNNTGTINKTGAGVYDLGTDFNNDGTVNIQGGTLRLAGSGASNGTFAIGGSVLEQAFGTQTFTSASSLSGSGTLRTSGGSLVVNTTTANFGFSGTVQTSNGSASFAPSMTLSQLTLSGGTTTFNGAVSTPQLTQSAGVLAGASVVTLTGPGSTWSGGTWTGNGTVRLASGAVLTASGSTASTQLAGRTLEIQNGASAIFNGEIESEPGTSVINNAGTLTLAGTRLSHVYNASGTITVNNTGTIEKTGTGAYILGANLNNNQTGDINASGTLVLAGGTLTNAGTLRPAGAGTIGTLNLGGNFVQTGTGVIEIETIGTAPGDSDVLAVSGNAALGGLLELVAINGYTPSGASAYADVLTYASRTGAFEAVGGAAFPALTPTYGANGLTIAITTGGSIVCPTGFSVCWIGTSDGSWNDTAQWNTGAVPTATDDVYVAAPGSITITAANGGAVNRLVSEESFLLAGGTFLLNGASSVGQTLAITGGILQANANLAAGSITLNGGALNVGAGATVSIANQFAWSGGGINGAGTSSVLQIAAPATVNVSGATKALVNVAVVNAGQMNLGLSTNSMLQLNDGASISNSGTLTFTETNAIGSVSGSGSLTNTGTIAAAASRTGTVQSTTFANNGGTLQASAVGSSLQMRSASSSYSGTTTVAGTGVRFDGGAHTFSDGATVTGQVNQSSAITFNSTAINGTWNQSGGSTSIAAGDTLTLNGTANWSGGGIFGAGPGAALALTTGDVLNVSGATRGLTNVALTNAGQVNVGLDTNGMLQLNDGASIANSGALTFAETNAIGTVSGSGSFANAGTIAVAAGRTGTVESTSFSNGGGALQTGSGSVLRMRSGNSSYSGATTITGTGVQFDAGTHTFADGASVVGQFNQATNIVYGDTVLAGVWNLSAGTALLGAGKTITLNGTANWSGGGIVGSGPTSALALSSGDTLNITGSTKALTNARVDAGPGSAVNVGLNTNGMLQLNDGASITNSGTLTFTETNAIGSVSGSGSLTNTGTIAAAASRTGTVQPTTFANNGGTLQANAAGSSLQLHSGSSSYSGTTTLNGTGVQFSSGTHSFADGASVNGVLNQSANLVFGTVALNGTWNQSGGNALIDANDTLSVNGIVNWSGGGIVGSGGSLLQVAAPARFNMSGATRALTNVALVNAGVMNLGLNTNAVLQLNDGASIANASTFTFVETNAIGTGSGSGSFVNNGTLTTVAGVAGTVGSTSFTNAGLVRAAANASVALQAGGTHTGAFEADTGGTVAFSGGTHNLGDGSRLTNGLVQVNGGSLNLVGTGAGTLIPVGAVVSLSGQTLGGSGLLDNRGTLNLGNSTVAGSVTNTGTLNVTGSSAVNGARFDQNNGILLLNAGSTLTKNSGVFAWNGGTLGGPGTLTMANGALFDIAGTGARVLDGPTLNIGGLGLQAGSLEVRSGSLTTAGISTIVSGATLVLNGGTFNNTAPMTVAGTLDLRTGSLALNGDASHTGSFLLGSGTTLAFASGIQTLTGPLSGNGTVVVSGATVTSTGSYSAATTNVSGGTLALNGAAQSQIVNVGQGGTLATGGTVTFTSLNVSGGTVDAQGTLNATNLSVGSGAVNGAGTVNVANFTQSGGSVDGTGTFNVTNRYNATGGSLGTRWRVMAITHTQGDLVLNRVHAAGTTSVSVSNGALRVVALGSRAGISGSTGVTVNASGDLVLQGGSGEGASAFVQSGGGPCTINVGGTTRLIGGTGPSSNAFINGTPDVGSFAQPIRLAGPIEFIDGSGGTAQVQSFSPSSVYVNFPTLSSGGYTVNGVEVTSAGSSGFFAGGAPAVLNSNLFITYGALVVPPPPPPPLGGGTLQLPLLTGALEGGPLATNVVVTASERGLLFNFPEPPKPALGPGSQGVVGTERRSIPQCR